MSHYRALLVGNSHYPKDPANLPDLNGPLNDVSRLGEVLTDQHIGMFSPTDVTALTERDSYEIAAALEQFFNDATRDDVLLFYYSGHGVRSDDGSLLFLCGRNAQVDLKLATMVSSETVNRMICGCAAAAVVIVLDCCYAGAFKSGEFAADLRGKGRFVLTAGRAKDRALDADRITEASRFTGHLLRGLRGEALLPGFNHVSISDLYRYVHRRMVEDGSIIPVRYFDGEGDIALTRHAIAKVTQPSGTGLSVSETRIDLGDVYPDDVLPVEHVRVAARGPDGMAVGWTAQTEADWVSLRQVDSHLEMIVAPRPGNTRANVVVRNEQSGETQTIRIVARIAVPAAAPPSPTTAAQPSPLARGHAAEPEPPPMMEREAAPPLAPPQHLVPTAAEVDYYDISLAPTPAAKLTNPRYGTPFLPRAKWPDAVRSVIRASRYDWSILQQTNERARNACGVEPTEQTVALLSLDNEATILFTDKAMYWIHGAVSAITYNDFPRRAFSSDSTNVFLGNEVSRPAGSEAATIASLLSEVREALMTSPSVLDKLILKFDGRAERSSGLG
jgi:hypothetical protein